MTSGIGNGDGRTVQKLSASQHQTKRYSYNELDETGFTSILQKCPPPLPPTFFRKMDFKEIGAGKVKVILRISNSVCLGSTADSDRYNSFVALDKRKRQVTLTDPTICNELASEDRRLGIGVAPRMFTFDAVFSQEDSQAEICAGVLTDVVHAVINGTDGCLFSFGQVGLGKSYTMIGNSENTNTIGIIPCAISWLFKGISEQKQRTGARFSVRVSAVEIGGPTNQLKDLLVGYSNESEQSPGVYLQDDHLFTNQSPPHCELRVPNAEKAGLYLDAALECRSFFKEEMRDSHFLFTLHIYQYSVAGKGGVAGGRSRLHLIDLGNTDRSKASGGIPLSGVGNLILAILNGQKHLPYKEHKLTHLLKECLGPASCHATMIAHISPFAQNYLETLTTVQLASRIHRMKRRRIKFFSPSISNSSGGSSGEDIHRAGKSSEPDPSSSDLSADTVIYVGRTEEATDGEHPPVYIPSLNSGDNRCSLSKALKDEHKLTQTIKPAKIEEKIRPIKTIPNHRISTRPSSSRSSSSRREKYRQDSTKYSSNDRSDEQWIDGPRISKSRIAEAFQMMKKNCHIRKRETWIDGPMKEETTLTYGYMDSHKKHMIKKWVEHQSIQLQKTKQVTPKVAEVVSPKDISTSSIGSNNLQVSESFHKKHKILEKMVKTKGTYTDDDNEDEDEPELPPALPLIQPLSSREVSIESLDQILKERMLSTTEYDLSFRENFDQLEIIEVEEPLEPVPMQDKCLQVSEEDIILCTENPLPEVDQQSTFRNSLRNLSEENLSAISSYADTMSVFNDLERFLPRYLNPNGFYNDYEDIEDEKCLTNLHKLYCTRFETPDPIMKSYKSMTLSDISPEQQKVNNDDSSIYSEPIYLQERFCQNCRANMYRLNTPSNEYTSTPFFSITQNTIARPQVDFEGRFQRYIHKQKELSELRQPDGASNPNLEENPEREPGNGACSIDAISEYKNAQSLTPQNFLPTDPLNFETGLSAIKLKHKIKGVNKLDSSSGASNLSPTKTAESRYENVIRDNDFSNNDCSEMTVPLRRRNKCKHNHGKSFCSWFLNPFTCKYVENSRETDL